MNLIFFQLIEVHVSTKKGRKIASMRVVLLRNYLNGDVKITREVLQIQILNAQCK